MNTPKIKEDWIKITAANFYYLPEKSENISQELHSDAPLVITGRFIPRQTGLKKLIATLTYRETNQSVSCETQTMKIQALSQRKPAIMLITKEGKSLIGPLTSLKEGPEFQVSNSRLAWNPFTQDLVCLGAAAKGRVFNTEKNKLSSSFKFEGGNQPQKLIWNNNLKHFIAVGNAGSVYLSQDGLTWNHIWIPVTNNLMDICWSTHLQQYMVVGDGGTVIKSTDGQEWQLIKTPINYNLISITYSDELNKYVVLHENLRNQKPGVLTSTDGIDWKYHAEVMPSGGSWKSIAWGSSNKQFVAVGSDRHVLNSNDGLTWSKQQLAKQTILLILGSNYDLNEVIYSSRLNAFVTIGTDFSAHYSYNGKNWSNLITSRGLISGLIKGLLGSSSSPFTSITECAI